MVPRNLPHQGLLASASTQRFRLRRRCRLGRCGRLDGSRGSATYTTFHTTPEMRRPQGRTDAAVSVSSPVAKGWTATGLATSPDQAARPSLVLVEARA